MTIAQDIVRARAIFNRNLIANAILVVGVPTLFGKLGVDGYAGKSFVGVCRQGLGPCFCSEDSAPCGNCKQAHVWNSF